jgi:hypothetical protein
MVLAVLLILRKQHATLICGVSLLDVSSMIETNGVLHRPGSHDGVEHVDDTHRWCRKTLLILPPLGV